MRIPLIAIVLTAAGLVGCDQQEPAPAPAADSSPAKAKPIQQVNMGLKLEYTIEIKPDASNPPKYIVTWSVKVPTGGWKLTTDKVLVEDQHRELRMASAYVTLEEPTSEEIVTQAVG